MMHNEVFISLTAQTTIFTVQNAVFAFSMILNCFALFCLLKQTPPHQATFRNYLILTQVMLIIFDLFFDLAAEPLPLFPIPGGFCCGWLCAVVPLPYIVILMCNVGVSILICIIYRHQAILFDANPLKLGQRSTRIIRVALLSIFYCPVLIYALKPIDYDLIEREVDENNLGWVRDRCTYYFEKRSTLLIAICLAMAIILFAAVVLCLALFGHMYFVLHQERAQRSLSSVRMIKRSLTVILIQMFIPLCVICCPAIIIFVGLAAGDFVRFELSLSMFYLIFFHSIGHNVILLSVTSVYRKFIYDLIRCKVIGRNCQFRNVIVPSSSSRVPVQS